MHDGRRRSLTTVSSIVRDTSLYYQRFGSLIVQVLVLVWYLWTALCGADLRGFWTLPGFWGQQNWLWDNKAKRCLRSLLSVWPRRDASFWVQSPEETERKYMLFKEKCSEVSGNSSCCNCFKPMAFNTQHIICYMLCHQQLKWRNYMHSLLQSSSLHDTVQGGRG